MWGFAELDLGAVRAPCSGSSWDTELSQLSVADGSLRRCSSTSGKVGANMVVSREAMSAVYIIIGASTHFV
jgi:hypothetical protein